MNATYGKDDGETLCIGFAAYGYFVFGRMLVPWEGLSCGPWLCPCLYVFFSCWRFILSFVADFFLC